MRLHMNSFVLLVSGLLVPGQTSLLDSVRFASKKTGGSSKNRGGKSPGKRYGFKKQDGNISLPLTPYYKCCSYASFPSISSFQSDSPVLFMSQFLPCCQTWLRVNIMKRGADTQHSVQLDTLLKNKAGNMFMFLIVNNFNENPKPINVHSDVSLLGLPSQNRRQSYTKVLQ